METLALLGTAAVVLVAAVAASAAFRRTKVPDVLLLILFGALVGPVANRAYPGLDLLDPAVFRAIAPAASIAAVLVILFDGGLEIKVDELRRGARASAGVAILAFLATAALAGFVAWVGWGLPVPLAVLLGLCFGGAGVAIVLPLIQRMGVSRDAIAFVSLETAVSDVLLVVGAVTLAGVLADPDSSLLGSAVHFAWSLAGGLGIGLLLGWLWSRALARRWSHGHQSLATVGAVFGCYALAEVAVASGPLAVLAFGLVLGNSGRTHAFARSEHRPESIQSQGESLGPATFHRQAALAVRAFVFVGLGVTLDLAAVLDLRMLGVAILIVAAVLAARIWALGILARRLLPGAWDRLAVTLMFPLGLPTAAAAILPWSRFQLEGTRDFPSLAALVIVVSILVSSLLVATVMQPTIKRRLFGVPAGAP